MSNPQSHSAVFGAITRFLKPIFGASSVTVCADQSLSVPAVAPSGALADEVVVRMVASLLKTGRQATALSMIERACEGNPFHAEYHNSRGLVLRACHRDAEALEAFDTALALRPDYQEAFANWQRSPGFTGARPT